MKNIHGTIANLLKNFTFNNIRITDVKLDEDGVEVEMEDSNTDTWGEDYFNGIYNAIFEHVVQSTGKSQWETSFRITEYRITAGISGVDVNILNPMLNVMPAFVRHQFVLPVYIKDFPGRIGANYFVIPHSVPVQVKRIVDALLSQSNVPQRYEKMFHMIKRGVLMVKLPDLMLESDVPFRIRYELPAGSGIRSIVDVSQRFKLKAVLDIAEGPINISVLDDEEFYNSVRSIKTEGPINHEVITGIYRAIERMCNVHKIKIGEPSHTTCDKFIISTPLGEVTNQNRVEI